MFFDILTIIYPSRKECIINKNFNKKIYLFLLSSINFFSKTNLLKKPVNEKDLYIIINSYQLLKFNYLKLMRGIFTKSV